MDFSMRSLTLISLGLGLIATGILSLAIATDYWLFSSEPVDFENMVMNGEPSVEAEDFPPDTLYNFGPDDAYHYLANETATMIFPTSIKLHSGLWRVCVYYEEGGGYIYSSILKYYTTSCC